MRGKRELKVVIAGDAKGAIKALEDVGAAADKKGGVFTKVAKVVAAAMASMAIAVGAFAVAGVKGWADFDAKLTQSTAIMTGVTDDARQRMSDAAREIGRTTKFGAAQAAEAYYFLASAGMDVEQSIAALPQVAAFAQAGMFDLARATDLATDAQSALGLSVADPVQNLENLTRVTDVLVKANTLANASVEQFSEALTNKAGAALAVMNKDVEEGAAVLAVYADKGVKGAAAGEGLSIMLRDVTRAAEANKKEWAKLGIEVFDQQGNLKNLGDVVEELSGPLGDMSDAQMAATLDTLGLTRSVGDQIKLLTGSQDAIRGYEAELRNAGGTVQDVAGKQMQTFWAQLGLLKDQIFDVALGIGERLMPHLMRLVEALQRHTPAFEAFVDRAMTQLADIIDGVVIPALRALGDWWQAHGPAIVATAQTMGRVVTEVFGAVAAAAGWVADHWGAIGPIISVVAGLIAAVFIPHWIALGAAATVNAAKNVAAWVATQAGAVKAAAVHSAQVLRMIAGWAAMGARAMVTGAFYAAAWGLIAAAAVKNAAIAVAAKVAAAAKWAWMGVQAMLGAAKVAAAWLIALGPIGIVIAAVAGVAALIVANWDWIKEKTAEVWGAIVGFFTGVWERITEIFHRFLHSEIGQELVATVKAWIAFFAEAWARITAGVRAAWNAITGFLRAAWQTILNVGQALFNALRAYFTTVLNVYRSVFVTVWNAITGFLRAAWETIAGVARAVFDALEAYFTAWLTAVKAVFGAVWNALAALLKAVWDSIASAARSVWSALKAYFTGWLNAVREAFRIVWDAVRVIFQAAWDLIKGIVTAALRLLRGDIDGAMQAIREAVSSALDRVIAFFRELPGRILSALGNLGSLLYDAGRQILTGMINGINSKVSDAVNAARNAVGSVVSGAKGMLGIRSPSRVFAQIGAFIAQGLRAGLTGEGRDLAGGMGEVAQLVTDIAKEMVADVAEATGAQWRAWTDDLLSRTRGWGVDTVNLFEDVGKAIVAALDPVPDQMRAAGEAIVGGLIEGMRSRLEEVRRLAAEIAAAAGGSGGGATAPPPASGGSAVSNAAGRIRALESRISSPTITAENKARLQAELTQLTGAPAPAASSSVRIQTVNINDRTDMATFGRWLQHAVVGGRL